MQQKYHNNSKYEILTPNGWEDFEGIFKNENVNKSSLCFYFSDNTKITATKEHRFFINKKEVKAENLVVGDKLDSKENNKIIVDIEEIILKDTYDIFNATNHVIVVNETYSHQCDEFAFLQPTIAKSFWTSLSPTLSTGGKCIITSTPDTDEDQFAKIWFEANNLVDENGDERVLGKNGFKPYFADWTAHPERDQEWADEQLAELSLDQFSREHLCKFVSFEETLINSAKIAQLSGIDPVMKLGQTRWYTNNVSATSTYVVSLDPSMGTGGDYAAIQVYEMPSLNQVAEWQSNNTPIESQIKVLRDILVELQSRGASELYWSVENNTLGEACLVVIRDTGEENFPGTMLHDPKNKSGGKRKGFTTTHRSKMEACAKLKQLVENGKLKINSRNLISELKMFVARSNTYEAKLGQTDDLISATLLFLRMADYIASWDDTSYRVMNSKLEIDSHGNDDSPMPILI